MKPAVLLMILTLLLAGGLCGYAAADEPIENVTGITEELSVLVTSLNATAAALTDGTQAGVSADLQTIAADLDTAQLTLAGTSLASSDVQDLISIKNGLETAASDLLYENADKAVIISTLQTAHTNLAAVEENLASTLAWAKNDQEYFSSDIIILEQSLTNLTNISASLDTATISLTAGTPDISVTLDQFQTQINELILIRDGLIADAAPLTVTDEFTGIINGLQTSADALQNGGDPFAVSADIISASAALDALNVQIADLPAPETAVPTKTPVVTETAATATPIQPTETVTVPTPEVIIPAETQAPEGDNGTGIIILVIVIVCIAGIGAVIFVIKKRSSREKSAGVKNDPLNITSPGSADQVPQTHPKKEEYVTVPVPESVRSQEPSVKPIEPQNPVIRLSDAGPAGQYKLIAAQVAKNRSIMNSEALSPRDLIDKENPDPLLLEYITLYEKVRYSPRSTPEDAARLTALAARILKENA